MINTELLKQILKSLELNVPDDENTVLESINQIDLFKEGFSSNEFSKLIEIREHKIGFTNRLMYRYSQPIQELEIFIELCKSITNNIFERTQDINNDKVFVLKKLQQKSTLVVSEIVYLIKGGYASASLSRWRTLLETSIFGLFLALNDEDISTRYLDHEIVDTMNELKNYSKNVEFLGFDEIPLEVEAKITIQYNEVLEKYGRDFRNSNGWASQLLNNKRPNLHDFMDELNLEYIKPFYKFSNNYVHSGAKSLMYNLGYIDGVSNDDTISGESNIGFTDSAQLCMLSFFNSTVSLLSISPNEEDLITILSLYNKINSIGILFLEVETTIINEELNGK